MRLNKLNQPELTNATLIVSIQYGQFTILFSIQMTAESASNIEVVDVDNGQKGEKNCPVGSAEKSVVGAFSIITRISEEMRAFPLVIGEIEPLGEDVPTYTETGNLAADNCPDASTIENMETNKGISVTVPRAGKLTKQIVTSTKWKTIRSILNEFEELAKAEGFDIAVEEDERELLYRVTLVNKTGRNHSRPISREHLDFINLFPNSIIAR